MRESQGEDEGVLEVHAWTEHASAPASGTRLIRRVAHARNRKPRVCVFFTCPSSSLYSLHKKKHRVGFNTKFDIATSRFSIRSKKKKNAK